MRTALISAADAEYFPLLRGWAYSILEHRPNSSIDLWVLNVGLEADQAEELKFLGVGCVSPQWDFDFADRPPAPHWYQAMTARPMLPKYFPDAEILIWIDSDAWLQDWRAIDALVAAASSADIAAVIETHPAYAHPSTDPQMRRFYAASFGDEIMQHLIAKPMINSGVFAAPRQSPLWKSWQRWTQIALDATPHKMSEQNALNAAVYCDSLRFQSLPAEFNWICGQSRPMFNPQSRRFTAPTAPFETISILHVTPRATAISPIQTTDGSTRQMPLDYFRFKESQSAAPGPSKD